MAFEDTEIMTNIMYFIREKYYHHAMGFITDGIKRYGNEPCLKLLNAICLIFEERYQEAIRELELLTDKSEVTIAVYLALATAYKKSKKPDAQDCDNKVRELRKNTSDLGYYFAGLTLFLFERYDKAREYMSRALKITTYTKETMNLHGWIDIMSGKEGSQKRAEKFFNDANDRDSGKNLDSLLGKVKCLEFANQFKPAQDLVSSIIVTNQRFLPAFLEKMKLQLNNAEWEEAYDTASRCILIDNGCVEALKFQILKILCQEGHYEDVASRIGELLLMLDKYEPKNAYQYHFSANLFARICGRNHFVLQQCMFLQEKALQICPDNIEYNNGMGWIFLFQNKPRDAIKYFKASIAIDESNMPAIQGVISCQLNEGMLKEAATQLEFLNEVQSNIEMSAELKYLTAVIKRKKNESQSVVLRCLDESIQIHFSYVSSMQLSPNYIYLLNPDFLVQIVQEYIHFAPQLDSSSSASNTSSTLATDNNKSSNMDNSVIKRIVQILEQIVRFLPGLQQAGFLLAKSYYMSGNLDKSRSLLETCLEADQAFSDGHILMAQIHLQSGNFKLADHALEVGMSYNFQVRESPMFHLMKGKIFLRQNRPAEAKKTLQNALQLPGVKSTNRGKAPVNCGLSTSDRLSIFLELAEAMRQLGEQHESAKILEDAHMEFAGTEEEARININNAELAVQRGDIEGALTMLRNVPTDKPYFAEARKAMANIYLKYRKDKKLYAACFKEMLERSRTAENMILLGDAYMEIQEPDKAIQQYEEARQLRDDDLQLIGKMGAALVKTHNFSEAVKYYRKLVKAQSLVGLRQQLCQLLINIQLYDAAKSTLIKSLGELSKSKDYGSCCEVVQLNLLLAEVYHHQNEPDKEIAQFLEAKDLQSKILKRVVVENPDGLQDEKLIAKDICMRLAKCYANTQPDQSIKLLEEARTYQHTDMSILLELSRLYMRLGDTDSCQQQCMALLQATEDPTMPTSITSTGSSSLDTNSHACLMMAELMLQKLDFDTALFHLKKLLNKQPNHYHALVLLIDVLRRNGELDSTEKYFKALRDYDNKECDSTGYNFCRGTYEWLTNNTSEALKLLNIARADADWEMEATHRMIEICINPDNDTIGEVLDQVDPTVGSSSSAIGGGAGDDSSSLSGMGSGPTDEKNIANAAANNINNLRTAENLLKELTREENHPRSLYIKHMILVSSKQKSAIERALQYFMDVLKSDSNNILGNYGAAVSHIMVKQPLKSKSFFNTIIKLPWTREYSEEFEKTWLLSADQAIQVKNIQLATELMTNCIKYNKSCYKAYATLAFIAEKDQQYKSAATHYQNAWHYCHKNDLGIGYKLAFNLLKINKNVDAIEVCLDILKSNPKYPKIRKEILDKARNSIRI